MKVSTEGGMLVITLEYMGTTNNMEPHNNVRFTDPPHCVFLEVGQITGNLKRVELPIPVGDDLDSEVLCAINCAVTKLKFESSKLRNVYLSCAYQVIRNNFDLVVNYIEQNYRGDSK